MRGNKAFKMVVALPRGLTQSRLSAGQITRFGEMSAIEYQDVSAAIPKPFVGSRQSLAGRWPEK